jgi:hypothetical protein
MGVAPDVKTTSGSNAHHQSLLARKLLEHTKEEEQPQPALTHKQLERQHSQMLSDAAAAAVRGEREHDLLVRLAAGPFF